MSATFSEKLDALAAALAAAQGEFETVGKTETNPFFKSKYAGLPSVVKAASPVLTKHGLSVVQLPGHDELGHTLTTMLLHSSGQFIAETMRLKPTKDDPQGLGSAITYGRRQSYMAALGLVADEDDDGNAASAPRSNGNGARSSAPPAASTIVAASAKLLAQAADEGGLLDKLQLAASHVHGEDVGDCSTVAKAAKALQVLTLDQAQRVEAWIEKKHAEAATA